MRRKSVLLILALALLLTMGGPAFAEYPGRLAANAMTNLMPEEYAVVENSSTPLHEILHMDRATIEEMMGQEPYYTFWIIEGNRQIGLDDSLSLEPGDEITIEIRNTTGLNHRFKVYYFQYEDVAPEEANTGDFDDNPDIYGPGLGVDGNEPADEPIEMPVEEIKSRFSDISSDKWYYTKVVKLAEKGIITGYDDGTFKPSNNVTVAEFMVMLNRALKTMDQSLVQSSVTNISLSGLPSWAENDITTIARKVSDNGYDEMLMNFEKTNAPIKRGQVVLLTSESIAFPGKGEGMGYEEYFDDVNKPYTAWSIGNLVENGILNGYPDGTFKPNNNITRAEVAAIINNLISVGETGFYFRAD